MIPNGHRNRKNRWKGKPRGKGKSTLQNNSKTRGKAKNQNGGLCLPIFLTTPKSYFFSPFLVCLNLNFFPISFGNLCLLICIFGATSWTTEGCKLSAGPKPSPELVNRTRSSKLAKRKKNTFPEIPSRYVSTGPFRSENGLRKDVFLQKNPRGEHFKVNTSPGKQKRSVSGGRFEGRTVGVMESLFERYAIVGDGNCLFRAISLHLYGTQENHMLLRYKAVAYLREHWKDVRHHLVIDRERLRDEERYCREMEAYGTYGTSVECFALSEVLQRNVVIFLQERTAGKIIRPKSKPIVISRRRYSQTIYLQLLGNPENGHFELLKPLIAQ